MKCIPCGAEIGDTEHALFVHERRGGEKTDQFNGVALCVSCAKTLDKRLVQWEPESGQ